MGVALIIGAQYEDAQSILETALVDSEFLERPLKAEPLLKEAVERTANEAWASRHDILICLHYLAKIYCQQGRYRESEELALRAKEASVKELGEQDHTTLGSMTTLAHLYFVQGRYKEAAVLQEKTLDSCKTLFGIENIRTHKVRQNLARTYDKQGHIAQAEKLYLQANAGFLGTLKDGHKYAIQFSAELAEFYLSQGRLQDAVPILEKNIEMCHRLMGRQHSATLKYSSKLGFTYCLLSRFDEAESVLKNTQEALERNLQQENHEEPQEDIFSQMLVLTTLVTIYDVQMRLREAEPLLVRLLEMATERYGEIDSITMRHVEGLATNYKAQERWYAALPLQKKIFDVRKETLGEYHEDTLAAMDELAVKWHFIGRTDEAMKMVNTITRLRSENCE